jgi:hypothetical protein
MASAGIQVWAKVGLALERDSELLLVEGGVTLEYERISK